MLNGSDGIEFTIISAYIKHIYMYDYYTAKHMDTLRV